MADTPDVVAALPDRPDVSYIGLCLNLRGAERALRARDGGARGVDEIGCVAVASDAFGLKNQGQTAAESVAETRAMLDLAQREGLTPQATIAMAFGCPFEGAMPPERVLGIAERLAEAGPVEIAVADTIGVATPGEVRDLIGRLRERLPSTIRLRAHFHDTRGTGVANAWAAWEAGVDVLDGALGGLGGCPFAPGAAGNVATEDLLYLFDRSAVATGIDLEAAIATNRWLAEVMGKPLPSRVARAGGLRRPLMPGPDVHIEME